MELSERELAFLLRVLKEKAEVLAHFRYVLLKQRPEEEELTQEVMRKIQIEQYVRKGR